MNTGEYLAGFITAKQGELQGILDTLASDAVFSESEMQHMREKIDLIDATVRSQHRDIQDRRLRQRLTIYEQIMDLTVSELARREQNRGRRPPESEGPMSADDLRRALTERREGRYRNEFWGNPIPPSGRQIIRTTPRLPSPSTMDTDDSSSSTGGRRTRHTSPTSTRSRSSIASYVSTRQTSFDRPQRGVALPPILDQIPYLIDRRDRDLIGRSEFYIQKPDRHGRCPQCREDHRMYRCGEFLNFNLLDRWYHALIAGVCLNCLRPGHSSFKCIKKGACNRCGTRHNSLLCRRHPANK